MVHMKKILKKEIDRGPLLVENPPANTGDMGSITGLGKFHIQRSNWACASQLLSLCFRDLEPQLLKPVCLVLAPRLDSRPRLLQLEKAPVRSEDPVQPQTNETILKIK